MEKDFLLNFIIKVKKIREDTTHANLLAVCNDDNFKQIKQKTLVRSGTMGKWGRDYIHDVSNLELVGKHMLQNGIELGNNCFAGSKGDESNTGNFDNDSDSGCSDDELYTWLS